MLKKIKKALFLIEQRVPYIPDFSNAGTIIRILSMSFFLCVIYSFSSINQINEFYNVFIPNLKKFFPYVAAQILLLISFSKLILRKKSFFSILIILVLNFISVYIVHSLLENSFNDFFENINILLAKFCLSFGIIFLFLIYFDWRQKNIDPAHTMSKLIFLQSKMRPHFLFNTLNSIVSLIKKKPDVAKKMLLNLSALLRASLKDEEVSMYSLKEEIDLCQKYLEIETMRLGERLTIEWDIDEEVLNSLIPRLTLQPLIENGVLHGIQHIADGGVIRIEVKKTNKDRIVIKIINPVGKKKFYSETKHNNISLNNLKERLDIYYNANVSFNHRSKDGIYTVLLIVPNIKIED